MAPDVPGKRLLFDMYRFGKRCKSKRLTSVTCSTALETAVATLTPLALHLLSAALFLPDLFVHGPSYHQSTCKLKPGHAKQSGSAQPNRFLLVQISLVEEPCRRRIDEFASERRRRDREGAQSRCHIRPRGKLQLNRSTAEGGMEGRERCVCFGKEKTSVLYCSGAGELNQGVQEINK